MYGIRRVEKFFKGIEEAQETSYIHGVTRTEEKRKLFSEITLKQS